jgi:hypothetical protein
MFPKTGVPNIDSHSSFDLEEQFSVISMEDRRSWEADSGSAFYKTLCGLVVRVTGYRSRGPDSIPVATRFIWEVVVWNGVYSASWEQLRSYLEEKVAVPV